LYQKKDGPVPYWFNVGVNNNDGHEMCKDSLDDPLGDGSHKCSTIFKDDIFGACKSMLIACPFRSTERFAKLLVYLGNNGGRGGYIKVGCLVYAFDVCSGKGDIPNEGICFTSGMGAPEVAA
jgi:hypothetical protein